MRPGELLGDRFEIERPIGSGGMGTVFRARDPISGETVAVKVISGEQSHLTGRFAREIKVLAELSHPGIVRYISHGVTSLGELFLVMEWLDGEVLKSRLQRGALAASEAVTLATRVAEALGAAHARGVVHRDLKPSNLFLCGGRVDQVKVLDFGIAQREGPTQLTQTGMMLGTPGYMAPEQARASGQSGQIDARADVFALGCVLFQCLTGVPPFDGDTTAAILAKILFDTAPRVSDLWPEVPEKLDALVAQMLSKEPVLRPSDGANLAAALAALGPLARTTARDLSPRLPETSGGERRLLAVVMLGPPAQDDGPIEDLLRRAVVPYGGRFEQLADGSTVVMLDADHQAATDQAARAARCALEMSALAKHRPLAIAMGRTESGSRLPEGDVITRASRLVAHMAQRPGDLPPIALDEVSAGLLDARFDVREHESQLRLSGERAVMQGARTLLGRPTSCVGRDWELGALVGILDECIEEPAARVAVVTAAAGMGKSRLGAEFVSRARQRHPEVAVWLARGDSLRAGSTLDLLAQALRGALGILEGEPLAERHDKLRGRIAGCVPAADRPRVTAFLGELIGAPFSDDNGAGAALRAARQDAQLMSEQMRKAWLDFLQVQTTAHPILLLLDDLHWGDFGTVRFIDAALRDLGKRPWMVLALARPEVFEVFPKLWADRQNVQELRLKELGRKAGERLVRQVLGDAVGSDTVERLVKQADGNAFYLEELIRAVAEGKGAALPETEHRLHPGAGGHDVAEREPLLVAPDRAAVRRLELLELDGPADHQEQLGRLERLHQVVLRAEAHGLHRRLDGAVGGHDHHRQVGMLGLDLPDQLDPVHAGQAAIGQDQIHVLGLDGLEGLLSALDRQDLVALQLECAEQRPQEYLVVLDQQEPSLHGVPPARGCGAGTAGSEMRTRVPEPGALSIAMSPPWRSTIFLTMDMPSPVPDGFVVKKGRKMRSRSSGAIPTPSSATSTTARSPSTNRSTVTRPASRRGSMASSAFFITLVKTWRSFCPSTAAVTRRSSRP